MLNLHPNAIADYNKKAEHILSLISINESQATSQAKNNFIPDYYSHATLDSNNIESFLEFQTDYFGEITSIYIGAKKEAFISEKNYLAAKEFLRSLSSKKTIRNVLSFKALETMFHRWITDRFTQKIHVPFWEYVSLEAANSIKKRKVLLPISYLSIQKSFVVGNVEFHPFDSEYIDRIEGETLNFLKDRDPQELEAMKNFFKERIRKNNQGYTVVAMEIEAEQERACEIAVEETEKSLSALRIFSASMLEPKLSFCATLWRGSNSSYTDVIFLDENKLEAFVNHKFDQSFQVEKLENKAIDSIFFGGLATLSNLLKLEAPNDFQEQLINALMIYSKVMEVKNPSDKLIFLLSSLESLLLKNPQEPIQQNLGERIAFLVSENPQERRKIIELTKKTYKMRSEYVHHGMPMENYDGLRSFMQKAAHTFVILLNHAYSFPDKYALIDEIETMKLS
jgi:hypothetical protein